jgi:hypothetical protein
LAAQCSTACCRPPPTPPPPPPPATVSTLRVPLGWPPRPEPARAPPPPPPRAPARGSPCPPLRSSSEKSIWRALGLVLRQRGGQRRQLNGQGSLCASDVPARGGVVCGQLGRQGAGSAARCHVLRCPTDCRPAAALLLQGRLWLQRSSPPDSATGSKAGGAESKSRLCKQGGGGSAARLKCGCPLTAATGSGRTRSWPAQS